MSTEPIINPTSITGRTRQKQADYQVFILRMWSENSHLREDLRLSIEDTQTGQRIGFVDWNKMLQYLRNQLKS